MSWWKRRRKNPEEEGPNANGTTGRPIASGRIERESEAPESPAAPVEAWVFCDRCHDRSVQASEEPPWLCTGCVSYLSSNGIGYVDGKHVTEYVETVKQLKRERRHDEAEKLLSRLIAAVEREAAEPDSFGPAPWYTEHLAIVYRKDKRYVDEIAICERYEALPGCAGSFSDRLPKARQLLAKQNGEHTTA